MPIYEFACPHCRILYTYFSRKVDTTTCPPCPRCSKPLARQVSLFSAKTASDNPDPWGMGEDESDTPDFNPDDERMERAVAEMGDKIDNLDDTDTAGAARTMREFAEKSGLKFNKDVNEALSRMEAGESGDDVEAAFGDALNGDTALVQDDKNGGAVSSRPHPYRKDPTLYDLATGKPAE